MSNDINYDLISLRSELIWGNDNQKLLKNKHIMVFGVGGVGSFAVEALARAGIGAISIVDFDKVDITNINRQLIATINTIGLPKVDIMKERINNINPQITVNDYCFFYDSSKNQTLFQQKIDYVIDAIDSVQSKLDLIEYCLNNNIQIVSSMGAGNRLDPTQLYITTLSNTVGTCCPLARKVRQMLKKRGVTADLNVLTSKEQPKKPNYGICEATDSFKGKRPPGSSPFVPPVAGFSLASYVVRDLLSL